MEDEISLKRPDYLIGRIEALEQFLRVTIATLPEQQREFIYEAAREYANNAQDIAERKATDPLREKARGAWDAMEDLKSASEDWSPYWQGIKDGTWKDPVQPDAQNPDA